MPEIAPVRKLVPCETPRSLSLSLSPHVHVSFILIKLVVAPANPTDGSFFCPLHLFSVSKPVLGAPLIALLSFVVVIVIVISSMRNDIGCTVFAGSHIQHVARHKVPPQQINATDFPIPAGVLWGPCDRRFRPQR